MKIQSIQGTTFGRVYYGADPKSLTNTQKDVLNDINLILKENNITKRLEKIGCDVYIEPREGGSTMDVAVLKNVKLDNNNNMSYSKVIIVGGFSEMANRYKSIISNMEDVFSTDMLLMKFNRLFSGYEKKYYKRFINHV